MKKKSILPVIIVFFLILLLAAAGALYVLQYSDLLLKPSQKFYKYTGKMIENVASFSSEPFKSMQEANPGKTVKTTSSETMDFDLSNMLGSNSMFDFEENEEDEEEETPEKINFKYTITNVSKVAPGPEVSERITLQLDTASFKKIVNDHEEDITELIEEMVPEGVELETTDDIVKYFTEEPALDILFYMGKNSIGVRTPSVYDKGFVVQNSNLKKMYKNLIDEEVPKELPNKIQIIETAMSEEKQTALLEFLKTHFTNTVMTIDEGKYVTEKTSVDFNGKTFDNADKISLSLTPAEFMELLKAFINNVNSDPTFTDLFGNEATTYVKDLLEAFDDIKPEELPTDPVVMSVYAEKSKPIKFELSIDKYGKFEFGCDDTNFNGIFTKDTVEGENSTDVGFTYTITMDNTQNGDTTTTNAVIKLEYDEDAAQKQKDEYAEWGFTSMASQYDPQTYTIKAEVKKTSDTTLDVTADVSIVNGENDPVTTTSTSKVEFVDEKVDSLDNSNSIILNTQTQESMSEVVIEILQNIADSSKNYDLIRSAVSSYMGLVDNFTSSVTPLESHEDEDEPTSTTSPITDVEEDDEDEEETPSVVEDTTSSTTSSPDELFVQNTVKKVLNGCLTNYKNATEEDSNANLADYLNITTINDEMPSDMPTELIDGTTLEVKYNNNTYKVTIAIDGSTWELTECTAKQQ